MRNLNSGAILFNLAGALILLTVFGYAGRELFRTNEVSRCSLRYPPGKQLAFDDHSGSLLTPIELQGRAGSREWGLLKNARIVKSTDRPDGASMQVELAAAGGEDGSDRNGVGFTWQTSGLTKATSACLSYSVRLPQKFAFDAPGLLPGLYSASNVLDLDDKTPSDGFTARVGWGAGGGVGVDLRTAAAGRIWQDAQISEPWPVGRWIPVEQEIVLNAPGAENGALRMWIDGKLQVENPVVAFKSGQPAGFSGVVADIGYAGDTGSPATLEVSPFVVQWQ